MYTLNFSFQLSSTINFFLLLLLFSLSSFSSSNSLTHGVAWNNMKKEGNYVVGFLKIGIRCLECDEENKMRKICGKIELEIFFLFSLSEKQLAVGKKR